MISLQPRCGTFSLAYTLDWGDTDNADLDAYMKEVGSPAVYFDHMSDGALTLDQDAHPSCSASPTGPEHITGNFTATGSGRAFRVWYNQYSTCAAEIAPVTNRVRISNTGSVPLCITVDGGAGTQIAPGAFLDVAGIAYAGYGTGDQSGYATGTLIHIASGACP